MDISLVIKGKLYIVDESAVHYDLNVMELMGGQIWSEANQKWCAFECAVLLLYYYRVTDTCQDCVLVERAADYLACLYARSKEVHSKEYKK